MGGSKVVNTPAVYGMKGVPAATNTPGGRAGMASWTDLNGNFWLFGGAISNDQSLNDLWKYSQSNGEWTWESGGDSANNVGIYGTLKTAASDEGPGARSNAATWTDGSGNFWLFGGIGYDSAGNYGYLQDLWEFSPSNGEWTWMGGPSTIPCTTTGDQKNCSSFGVYGTEGKAAAGNIPGGRAYASNWTDSSGNLWFFGGYGFGSRTDTGTLNDLWEYSATSGLWTYVSGSTAPGAYDSPGQIGVPGTAVPDPRAGAANWTDKSGHLWLFGGGTPGGGNEMTDLWEFDPATTEWTWWGGEFGSSVTQSPVPARQEPASWTDSSGNFWLFGGTLDDFVFNCGYGCEVIDPDYYYDLWQYDPGSNQWTKVSGSDSIICTGSTYNGSCSYTPADYSGGNGDAIYPGGRSAVANWVDSDGNPWIYGGYGIDSNGKPGWLGDLWMSAPPAATPTFNPPGGSYTGVQSVSISDASPHATIYYTLDGSFPTTSSPKYQGPVAINEVTETLKAIAIASEFGLSGVASATYNLVLPPAAAPVITPSSGNYDSVQMVTITSSSPGATIYYAFDHVPTTASTLYSGPFKLATGETVEAVAIAPGFSVSPVSTAAITIDTTYSTLKISGNDPYTMSCQVSGSVISGVSALTGTVTFTDVTTGKTLGTAPVGTTAVERAFLPPTTYSLSGTPTAAAVGDFNGDGFPDIAVANGGSVDLLFGNGDGTFQAPVTIQVGIDLVDIVAVHNSVTGHIDLLITDMGGTVTTTYGSTEVASGIWDLQGKGDGTFTQSGLQVPVNYTGLAGIAVGNFNGDGYPDLAVTNYGGDNISGVYFEGNSVLSYLGNSSGGFTFTGVVNVGGGPGDIVAGLFSGKSEPEDLVVANLLSNSFSVALGRGNGNFTPQPQISVYVSHAVAGTMTVADFNGDGNLDFAIVDDEGVLVLLGNGDGTFQNSPKLQIKGLNNSAGVTSSDYNGDGIPDLAITEESGNDVAIYAGNGDGTFNLLAKYPVGYEPTAITTASLTGTGNPDLVITSRAYNASAPTGSVTVLLNQQSATVMPSVSNIPVFPGTNTSHTFQCSYSGDAHYEASTSAPITYNYPIAATPVFSLLTGIYPDAQPISILEPTSGVSIYYATDGSNPTTASTLYTGPFSITSSTKLKAIASGLGYAQSAVSEAVYNITNSPMFSVAKGSGTSSEAVVLSDTTPGALIYYTTDGTAPTIKATKYAGPITLTKATTIRAFAASAGQINSPMVSETFNLAKPATPTITWAVPRAITYGQALSAAQLDASAAEAGTFSYSPRAGAVLDAGMHTVTATFTPADRVHFAATTKTIEIVVYKHALMVSSRLSKVYGAAMPKLSYKITGFVNRDTEKVVSGELVLATKATAKSVVGNYAITVKTDTLKAANYAFDFAENELTVTKAPLKVEAKSFTMPAGGPLPRLTYSFSGFVNGDTAKVVTGAPELTTTATAESKPGKYAIVVKVSPLKAENYSFEPVGGTLTVE